VKPILTFTHRLAWPLRGKRPSGYEGSFRVQSEKDPCLQEYQRTEERREELKQQIALLATRLLQDPEQHVRDLTVLLQLARDRDELVSLLA
jgi:hypothetical protein